MLYTIVAVLLVLWLIGQIINIASGLIHLVLLVAGLIFFYKLLSGRRTR